MTTDPPEAPSRANGIVRSLDRAPRQAFLGLSVALAVLVGVVDWATGPDLSLIIFYLVPVLVVAWLCAPSTAAVVAVLMGVEGFVIAAVGPESGASGTVLVWNALVRLTFFLLVVWLVAEQRHLLGELQEQAATDHLTGALNRRAFAQAAERELARARRAGEPVTVLYLDLDGLKQANDTVGHEAGDAMIEHVATTARHVLRAEDLFARTGGDEFAALLPGADQREGEEVARRLLAGFADRRDGGPVRASVGAWTEVAPVTDVEVLLQHADRLMYLAKQAGGHDVVSATPDDHHHPT